MENKKVCFLTVRNIFNTSCLPRYGRLLEGKFDIIYWDQHGVEEDAGAENHYSFQYVVPYGKSKCKKLFGYLKFKLYATKIIKQNNYDIIIILPTQTGILFNILLTKKYSGRYIYDIRDYTAEYNKIFYRLQKRLIDNSGITVITSPAYKSFLPEHKYLISHNIATIDEKLINEFRQNNKLIKDKIVISCIGSIRFIEQFKKVILSFANDERFELRFIGRGSEYLMKFCKDNSIKNVLLEGRFDNKDTISYYMDTDIIMNLYGNNNPSLDYALSNKLYYAATLGMPILVCPNTYMEKVAVGNGFGFVYDLDDESMPDKLFNYYNSINWETFYDNCDNFMEDVIRDEEKFTSTIKEFIR